MFLETERTPVQPANASLIHEMMGNKEQCGDFLVLLKSQAEEDSAFMQFAFDDETSGILEYRDEETLYCCTRPVTTLEAETALVEYLNGREDWKLRFQWDEVKLGNGALAFFEKPWVAVLIVLAILAVLLYKRGFLTALLK